MCQLPQTQQSLIDHLEEFKQVIKDNQIRPLETTHQVRRWPMPVWQDHQAYGKIYEKVSQLAERLFYTNTGHCDQEARTLFSQATGLNLACLGMSFRGRSIDDGVSFEFEGAIFYVRAPYGTRHPC